MVYDIQALPQGLDPANLMRVWEQHDTVFWDSAKGTKPRIYGNDDLELIPIIVDTAGKELDLEFYSKEFKDKEFWEREIYNCKNSPLYYWKNYGTSVWPHKDADMTKFLEELGLAKLSAADNEEAEKIWKEQKDKLKDAMAFVTKEHLEERKTHIDLLKKEYEDTVVKLEKIVEPFVKLVDSNNAPLTERKRCGHLIEKIKSQRPVLQKYSDTYRNDKGKWDHKILFVTDYKVLLRIFYDVLVHQGRIEEVLDSPAQ